MPEDLQTRQQMLEGYLREIRQRTMRDGVAIVKTDADGKNVFVDPFDLYIEPKRP